MPILTLTNSLGNPVNGPMSKIYKANETFGVDVGEFNSHLANISVSLGSLLVAATSANGAAYIHMHVVPLTVYTYSGKINFGVGIGSSTIASVVADTNDETHTGTVTAPEGDIMTLSLVTNNSGRTMKWDDVSVYENF